MLPSLPEDDGKKKAAATCDGVLPVGGGAGKGQVIKGPLRRSALYAEIGGMLFLLWGGGGGGGGAGKGQVIKGALRRSALYAEIGGMLFLF